jgi:sarcosine oxidase subunit beta
MRLLPRLRCQVDWMSLNILDNRAERRRGDDIAIVGAGVIGLAIAFHLSELGLGRITIYERSGIAAEASGVQPGGVRQQWGTRVNCLMSRESVEFYRDIADRLTLEHPPRLDPCGYLFLAHSEARLAQLTAAVGVQNELGIGSHLLSPSEIEELVSGLDVSDVVGASYYSEDGYFDKPQSVVEAFASASVRRGVTVEHSEITSLEQRPGGWLLRHKSGECTHAHTVVVAAGYYTPALLEPLGLTVPIDKEPRYLFFSDPISDRLLEPLVVSAERCFAAKQLADGRVLASDLSAGPSPGRTAVDWRRHVKEVTRSLLPLLQFVTYPHLVEGFYDVTPDHQAIIGSVDGCAGLWIAAGFSGHGFMIAPAVGRRLAAAVAGEPVDPLLEALSLRRFEAESLIPELQIV